MTDRMLHNMATDAQVERLELVDLLIKEESVQGPPKLRLVENSQVEQTKNTILKRKVTSLVDDYDIVQSKKKNAVDDAKAKNISSVAAIRVGDDENLVKATEGALARSWFCDTIDKEEKVRSKRAI